MENKYKVINHRSNALIKRSIISTIKILITYCFLYIILFCTLGTFNIPFEIDYVLSYIPNNLPIQSANLTALGALLLSLFIHVRTEIKDIDDMSPNSQIRAVSYNKFAKYLIYFVSAILFSHVIYDIYMHIFKNKELEYFDPPVHILLFFIIFMIFMVHLPGEHRVSLEGQCREKLYDLIVMDNLYDINFGRSFIEYLSNVDHADETSRRNFQKYLSAYSYTKPFANYLSRCVGYLSFKKYITQYIKSISLFFLLLLLLITSIYIDVFVKDLGLFFKISILTYLWLLLIMFFTVLILPIPQILEAYESRSWTFGILFCLMFVTVWGIAIYPWITALARVLQERRGGEYNIFEYFILLIGTVIICVVSFIIWIYFQYKFIKDVGQKTLNIQDLKIIEVLHFAKMWNIWLNAQSIYEEEFTYKNLMHKNDTKTPEIDYSDFIDRYNNISKNYKYNKKDKNIINKKNFIIPK